MSARTCAWSPKRKPAIRGFESKTIVLFAAPARSRSARCDHAHGRGRTIAPGLGVGRRHRESNGAADAVGLERLGLCIAGLKQPSAGRGETTECVANE